MRTAGARVEALAELAAGMEAALSRHAPPGPLQVVARSSTAAPGGGGDAALTTPTPHARSRYTTTTRRAQRPGPGTRSGFRVVSPSPRCGMPLRRRHAQRHTGIRRRRLRVSLPRRCVPRRLPELRRRGAVRRPLHPRRPRRRADLDATLVPTRGVLVELPARRRGMPARRDGRGQALQGTLRTRLRGGAARGRVRRRRHLATLAGELAAISARRDTRHRAVLRRACAWHDDPTYCSACAAACLIRRRPSSPPPHVMDRAR